MSTMSIISGANARDIFGLVCDAIVMMGYRSCGVVLAEPDYTVRVEMVRGVDENILRRPGYPVG